MQDATKREIAVLKDVVGTLATRQPEEYVEAIEQYFPKEKVFLIPTAAVNNGIWKYDYTVGIAGTYPRDWKCIDETIWEEERPEIRYGHQNPYEL